MSVSSATSKVQSLLSDISRIQSNIAGLARKQASESDKIARASARLGKNASASTIRSAQQDIDRAQQEIARLHQKNASEARDLARKQSDLASAQKDLMSEQQKEMKKNQDEIKKGQDLIKKMEADARRQSLAGLNMFRSRAPTAAAVSVTEPIVQPQKTYTAFISHASEDKNDIARPLAEALRSLGHEVWYDELTLKVGDSLRRTIDRGLFASRFGIVILSPSFFAKNWPQYELDGMVAREVEGRKVILPLWHKVTKSEVLAYSPTLADRVALSTAIYTVEEIASKIHEVLSDPSAS